MQWVLFISLTVYYYFKTVNFTFTSTWRLLTSLVLVNLGTMLLVSATVFPYITDTFLVLGEAFMIVAFIFIFDYHDRYKLTEPRGILKFAMFFLLGYILGRLLFPLILYNEINIIENSWNLMFITNIYTTLAFMRSVIYLNFENLVVQQYFEDHTIKYLRTISAIYLIMIVGGSLIFLTNIEIFEDNPLLGTNGVMFMLGIITFAYTQPPFRNLVFPINIVWIGVANEQGKIIYSYQIEDSMIHSFRYEDLIAKFEQSYSSINSLLSEALAIDLQIESFNGSQFSFVRQDIERGTILGIIDENNSSLVTYDYRSLFNKLMTHGSPFRSMDQIISNPEDLDLYLMKSFREGI